MASLSFFSLTPGEYKGKIVKKDGTIFELFKGDTIKINEKTAKLLILKMDYI
jgi:hypothetical protein